MTENLPAPSPAASTARGDLLAILAVVALMATVLLVPVTRDFIFTNVGTVFSFIGSVIGTIAGVAADAAHAVAGFFAGAFGGAA